MVCLDIFRLSINLHIYKIVSPSFDTYQDAFTACIKRQCSKRGKHNIDHNFDHLGAISKSDGFEQNVSMTDGLK